MRGDEDDESDKLGILFVPLKISEDRRYLFYWLVVGLDSSMDPSFRICMIAGLFMETLSLPSIWMLERERERATNGFMIFTWYCGAIANYVMGSVMSLMLA